MGAGRGTMEDHLHRTRSMILLTCFVVFFIVLHADANSGSFDDKGLYKVVIEREKVQADVASVDTPTEAGNVKGKHSSVIMYNKKGKPFRCLVPDRQVPVDEKDKLNDLNTTLIENALKPATGRTDDRNCVNLVTSGWWHYEFCFGKHVTQYHTEKGEVVQPVIILGQFSHAFDWSNVSRKTAWSKKDRHHTQYYENGSECDINGKHRRADVKIYCDSNNWGSDYIESVREPESCAYEVIVYSKRLCDISYFRKDKPMVGQIVCNPIGSTSSKDALSLEQVVNSNDKALLGFDVISSSSEEIEISVEQTEGWIGGTEPDPKVPVVQTPKRLAVESFSVDVSPNPYQTTVSSSSFGDGSVLKVDSEDDKFGGDEHVLEELREAREAVKARGRLTLDEEVAVETVFKSHAYIQNAMKLEGNEKAAALLRVMENLQKVLKMLEDEDTDEGFTAIMYSVTSLLLKQVRNASAELVYGKDGNRVVHAEHRMDAEMNGPTAQEALPTDLVPDEELYTEESSPFGLIGDVQLLLQKADRLREMKPFTSTEGIIYDLFAEADEQTQAWGAVEDDNPAKQQLWNEAREGWAITKFYVNQRRRLEDKNIRKEFEDNIIWITDWKIKSLESVADMKETFEKTIYNKFTGDVRHTDPWWRLDDDSSYHAYPFGIFDMWIPHMNELYPDEKEVVLCIMKAQIESYLFTSPEEAALMAGHNRMPGFQHALALVERAMKDITDPDKVIMARSFRQILFPHIRRMVSLLKTLVEWSKQNRKDAEYRMATKALDQQFSAAVSWASGMTGVVNAVRDLEKKHYGNERGVRFRKYPDEIDFYAYLKYEKNKPKYPLLPSEKHLDESYFEEPLDLEKFTLSSNPETSNKPLTLDSGEAKSEDETEIPTAGLSDDEKMIVKAFTKLSKASQKDSETEWDIDNLEEQSQVFGRRQQFAENAVKFLKDERRNLRDTFRKDMVSKMENIADRYGELEKKAAKLDARAKKAMRQLNTDDSNEEQVNLKTSYGEGADGGKIGAQKQESEAEASEDKRAEESPDLTKEFLLSVLAEVEIVLDPEDFAGHREMFGKDEVLLSEAFWSLHHAFWYRDLEEEYKTKSPAFQARVFGKLRLLGDRTVAFVHDDKRKFRKYFTDGMDGTLIRYRNQFAKLERRAIQAEKDGRKDTVNAPDPPATAVEAAEDARLEKLADKYLDNPEERAKLEIFGGVKGKETLRKWAEENDKREGEFKKEAEPKRAAESTREPPADSEQSMTLEKVLEDVIKETGIVVNDALDEGDSSEMDGLTEDEMLVARSYYALILSARKFAETRFTVKRVQGLGPVFGKLKLLAELGLAALTDDKRSITKEFRKDVQAKMEHNVKHYSDLVWRTAELNDDAEKASIGPTAKASGKPSKTAPGSNGPVGKSEATSKVANKETDFSENVGISSKVERLRRMTPFSSTEELIYDMLKEAEQATDACFGADDGKSEGQQQLMNEAKEAWAITRYSLEQRKRLGDKNIRKEFAEIVLWMCEWKLKMLKALSTSHGASESAVGVTEDSGDMKSSDPWWRPEDDDDSSYQSYPYGVFDVWVPHMNEFYPDEKEVVLDIMKAQIESYRFATPEEAARMSVDQRLPGFYYASMLIQGAIKDLVDGQKKMGKSFRQLIYPHARRMSFLLQHLVRWSKEGRKDAEYEMATKLLDEQFAAVVQWAAGMTKVVNTIRGAEKSHFGNERGERFRNHPNEIDFYSYLEYEKNKPKFPLLPTEELGGTFMKTMFEKPFNFRMMLEEFIRKNPENVLTLDDEDIEVDGTEDMGPYPDTLTDDETNVVKQLARSDFVTSSVRSSGKYGEVDPKLRSQMYSRSRSLAEKALVILKDENKNIRDEFKQKLLHKVEKIVSQYGELEQKALLLDQMKKDNEKLRAASSLLSDPDVDIDDWKKRFAETFERAIGRSVNGERSANGLAPSAKSKAKTFDEVLGNVDPKKRTLKEMEDIIRDRLTDFLGGGDVTFALMPGNGAPGQVLKGLDLNKLQSILNENNKQLQFVQQQESNYNLDDDDDS
ncbi:hypothetical protein RvY_04908 [Ramazzottius varieornatus]|uniref:Endoplasmic reticulum lectin 1 n=1 Tax=Ramazzottius varieornatus TaxID=947166 RepID=A0A1D1UZU8_RAMVA|nr:hypothetical protein RvY_04908 [Ramazzottius varieornatus]